MKLDQAALEGCVTALRGRELTLADLNEGVARVTLYARNHGYPAASAFLPEQTFARGSGVLRIQVEPGRYDTVTIENTSHIRTAAAERLARGLRSGEVIEGRGLETALYNIASLDGIQAAGVLSPGTKPGTSHLTIRVADGQRQVTVLYAENYGGRSTGRYRYGLSERLQDLTGAGDVLALSTLISNGDLRNYSVSYAYPVGHSGTRAGIGYSRMDYTLGRDLAAFDARGQADTWSLFGQTPLYRMGTGSLIVDYGVDYRRLRDDILTFSARKHSYAGYAGLTVQQKQGKADFFASLRLTYGHISPDSDVARVFDASTHTAGGYLKGVLDWGWKQTFDSRWDLNLHGQWQRADSNLDSSEEIYLGGANGVRAYPQSEASGDEGWQGTTELTYHTGCRGLDLSTYYDAGHVQLTQDGTGGGETLQGWGTAVTYHDRSGWFGRFDYARRIGWDSKASSEARGCARMWFIAGKRF